MDVVSDRLRWVQTDPSMATHIRSLAEQGVQFGFHLLADNDTAQTLRLGQPNIHVIASAPDTQTEEWPSFTLIDRTIPGSAILAVGARVGKDWHISEYDTRHNAQIIALARRYLQLFGRTGQEVQ